VRGTSVRRPRTDALAVSVAAQGVGCERGADERDDGAGRAADEHRREGERRGRRDLALDAAHDHLDRDKLADQGARGEDEDLSREQLREVLPIQHEDLGAAERAEADDRDDVRLQRRNSEWGEAHDLEWERVPALVDRLRGTRHPSRYHLRP
jgi:hypothetical protein